VEFFWIAKRRSGNLLVEANSHTVENKIIRKNIELSLLENAGKPKRDLPALIHF
jgi:hypothetical protein